jgi:hypothetical protein
MNIYDRFLEFEEENSVFNLYVDGVPAWERIRHNVYSKLKNKTNIDVQNEPATPHEYIRAAKGFFQSAIFKNPFLASESEIVFVGHRRRIRENDGKYWEIYCDPLQKTVSDYTTIHLEPPLEDGHKDSVPTNNIRYIDIIKLLAEANSSYKFKRQILQQEDADRLDNLSEEMKNIFKTEINLKRHVTNTFSERLVALPLYMKLLKIINPSVLIYVSSSSKLNIIEASQRLDIPVVELQHGIIQEQHIHYSYPGKREKMFAPDHFATWGEFWEDQLQLPVNKENIHNVGFKYINEKIKDNKSTENANSQDTILFISQSTIGTKLSQFASDLKPVMENVEFIYKLHPFECDGWINKYPWLAESDIKVIDDPNSSVYELFSLADTQIGVNSTVLFEGLSFGLNTYIYSESVPSATRPLTEDGAAKFVSSVNEFKSTYDSNKFPDVNRERFFAKDIDGKFARLISSIINEAE